MLCSLAPLSQKIMTVWIIKALIGLGLNRLRTAYG